MTTLDIRSAELVFKFLSSPWEWAKHLLRHSARSRSILVFGFDVNLDTPLQTISDDSTTGGFLLVMNVMAFSSVTIR